MPTGLIVRALVVAAIAAAVFLAGRSSGVRAERQSWVAREQVRLAAEAEAKRAEALLWARNSERVAEITKTVTVEVERVKVITNTIKERIEVYVPSDAPDLPAGWRVLHDAAARGEEPDPTAAGGPDAATVSAQDAASTVAENYGACRADQARLMALQEYVRDVVRPGGADDGR